MARQKQGPGGLIVADDVFALLAELEMRKAVRLQYSVSLLAIVPEPEGGGEVPTPRHLAWQLAEVVSSVIRGTDVIGVRATSSSLHALLVDASVENFPGIIERVTTEVSRHLFQLDGERKAVRLSVGSACFPTTAGVLSELLAQAEAQARQARPRADPAGPP